MIQGSPEWYAARCGKVTASRIADVVAKTKSGPAAARANYEAQLIAERLTGIVQESYTNAAMQWGIETEPQARAAYEFETDSVVEEVGSIDHPLIEMTSASPDGLIGTDGMLEIKCPNTATHIATLLGAPVPKKYILQMQWQMACTGRHWCDFVSFDPRMDESMRLFVKRFDRDDAVIKDLEAEVAMFLDDIEDKIHALKERYETE